jgi:hypothetical protein
MSVPRPVRRAVIFGAPFLVYLLGIVHPDTVVLGERNRLFLALHFAFPILICLLAWALLLLVDGVENRAATTARILVIPFAVAYTVFEAVAGIARGAIVWKYADLPAALQPGGARLISSFTHSGLARPLWVTASVCWLAVALAVVVALRRRAPLPALVLMTVGAFLFAVSHVKPFGPAGMAAFLAGVVWFELKPRETVDVPGGDERPVPAERVT